MAGSAPKCAGLRAMWLAAALSLVAGSSPAQILPWEVTVGEIEAGRIRNLAERLDRQYVMYMLRLGEVQKSDLVATATEIDRVIESLEQGKAAQSIPAPWTTGLRKQISAVDSAWGPVRKIAVASPYDQIRESQFLRPEIRRGDPLLLRYFDDLTRELVARTEALMDAYNDECKKTGLEVCPVARTSGYAGMMIERATKEAVYVVAGIEAQESRARLAESIKAYQAFRRANDESPFFAAALDPERGVSARAAGELLSSLRQDWDSMQGEFTMLAAGDEENFDLERMLVVQARLVEKVERLTAALVRYASLTYGS
ncbi:MAG: hypothetical protein QNK04_06650 [Myxococcota bacterium]|nr:hypothetical protein [Myxococcota bacterium]